MNISTLICSPVCPLYKISFALELKPARVNSLPNIECFDPVLLNAVHSPKAPYSQHALPITVSNSCPIVIRLGSACGLMIISGRMPSALNGISSSSIMSPMVPFCPQRLQNLSPITGVLSSRTRTFAIRKPSSPSVIKVLST